MHYPAPIYQEHHESPQHQASAPQTEIVDVRLHPLKQ